MLKIAITLPDEFPGEAERIMSLFEREGFDYVHIRKPGWSTAEVKHLIESIDIKWRNRLRLHGHFELLNEFNLAGVQINSRNPVAPYNALSVTKSCHSLDELADSSHYEYVTLSPVFDSISKDGYKQSWKIEDLKGRISAPNVIAMGGVTPDKIPMLESIGFAGVAMCGHLWQK